MRPLLATFFILFSGCVAPATVLEEPAPVAYDMGMHECSGNFFARIPEFAATDPWLPPGFKPADASSILGPAGIPLIETNRAFMGGFGADCGSFQFLNFWVAVEPPSLAEQEGLHWYEVAAYHQNVPFTSGLHGANHGPMEATLQNLTGTTLFSATDNQTIIDLSTFGFAQVLSLDTPLTFWQLTSVGTVALEAHVSTQADSGGAGCTSDYEWILAFAANCNEDDFIAGTLPTLQFGGTYRFYEGQFPV